MASSHILQSRFGVTVVAQVGVTCAGSTSWSSPGRLVVSRPGPAAAADVRVLLRRFPPRLVLAPAGHRLPGEVVVPPAGSQVTAGGLAVSVGEAGPRLAVQVGPARGPPGSVGSRMRLSVGARSYDLTTRALVIGVPGAPGDLPAQGADLVERGAGEPAMPPPTPPGAFMAAADDGELERALSAGAVLVRLASPTGGMLRRCALAGAAVVVPPGAVADAAAAGLGPERIVVDTLVVDVTGAECPVAATAVGVIRGGRVVRTSDVRGSRRVCDVLAAVLEAR